MTGKSNALISETSPYLLQHAYNPVHWVPWKEEYLNKAQEEDKLILVSIGYSACHWCHVMEHESFEDNEVADLMNRFFICIKVDREERPDIDQVYMTAVQLMTGRGGWPLNCFILPDGRPVYGGTYFSKAQWMNVLLHIADGYRKDKKGFEEYAGRLTEGIRSSDLIQVAEEIHAFSNEIPKIAIENWKKHFDNTEGGHDRTPKFPLPNNYLFLLKYLYYNNDEIVNSNVKLTLEKMALGGIYDQVGGGFCRYSVDGIWKLPHFEKMLYDNAQLVSLYSEAFKKWKQPLYRDIVFDSLEFVCRELMGGNGNFYSALDADSEKEEGKFYVWKKNELQKLLGDDYNFFAEVFNVNERGYWEHDNYILLRTKSDPEIIQKSGISETEFSEKLKRWKSILMQERENRVRPGLDDKTLLSWNALMATGFLDAYDAFAEKRFLETAEKNVNFILNSMSDRDGKLFHSYKNGKATVNGFLEDYAFFIQALIRIYQVTFNVDYLLKAKQYTEYVVNHFHSGNGMPFYFTSDEDPELITRTRETQDNVIPASNSQMAINLYFLGNYFQNEQWLEQSNRMLFSMEKYLTAYGSGYSNWLLLWLYKSQPFTEIVITGKNSLHERNALVKYDLPAGILIAGSLSSENLAMLKGRVEQNTNIYVCTDRQCHLPVTSSEATIALLKG